MRDKNNKGNKRNTLTHRHTYTDTDTDTDIDTHTQFGTFDNYHSS